MNYRESGHLRVLIANERKDRLAIVAPIVIVASAANRAAAARAAATPIRTPVRWAG